MITKVCVENFKKERVEQELTGRDLFIGPNGSGKSTRLQAVQIALLGYIPKVGKQVNATMAYALDDKMQVQIETDDGITLNRTFKRSVSKKGKVSFKGDLELVPLGVKDKDAFIEEKFGLTQEMIDISQFIEMSPNQRKDFIVDICGKHVKQKTLRPVIKSVCDEKLWNDDLNNIDNLNNLETHYQEKLNALKAELRVLDKKKAEARDKVVDTTIDPDQVKKEIEKLDEEIEDLTRDVASSASAKDSVKALKNREKEATEELNKAIEDLKNIQPEAALLKAKLQKTKENEEKVEKEASAKKKLDGLDEEIQALREKYAAIQAEVEMLQKLQDNFSGTDCQFIGEPCPEGEKLGKYLKQSGPEIKKKKKAMDKAVSDGQELKIEHKAVAKYIIQLASEIEGNKEDIRDLQSMADASKKDTPVLQEKVKNLTDEVASIPKMIAEKNVINTDIAEKNLEALKIKRSEQSKALQEAVLSRKEVEDSEKLSIDIVKKTEEVEKVASIIKFIGKDGLKGEIAQDSHQPLLDEMSRLLEPLSVQPAVQVDTDDKNRFDIGELRGRNVVKFEVLSDGEKIRLASAFLCALQQLKGSAVKLLLIEASELDNSNFEKLLESIDAFGDALSNVLIARRDANDEFSQKWVEHKLEL